MVLFRLGQGMFGAFLIPLSQSILFDAFPKEQRGQATAMFGLGVVVAPVMGPTIGATLTDSFSWRMVFFVNLPIAALAIMMLAGELPEDSPTKTRIDWTGVALMALGIGALQFLLDQGESEDWFASHLIQMAALTSVVAGGLFLIRGIGNRGNIIDLSHFADRNFAAGSTIIAGFAVAVLAASRSCRSSCRGCWATRCCRRGICSSRAGWLPGCRWSPPGRCWCPGSMRASSRWSASA